MQQESTPSHLSAFVRIGSYPSPSVWTFFMDDPLSKIVSSIQDSANTESVNTFWVEKNAQNVFHQPSRTLSSYF